MATKSWLTFPQKAVEPYKYLISQVQHTAVLPHIVIRGKDRKRKKREREKQYFLTRTSSLPYSVAGMGL